MSLSDRVRAWRAHLGEDHLLRNSLYILLSTGAMGGLGFLFWLVAARLFKPADVGVATTLVTATILISYASLLGFNSTFVRFLPTSTDRDAEIDTGLLLVFIAALAIAAVYILAVPSFVHALRFVRDSPLDAGAFIVLTAFTAVNLVTDSVFIAYRVAKYNFIVDGILQSVTKLALPFALVSAGAFGIFTSVGVAAVLAVGFSIYFMIKALQYRPSLRISTGVVRRVFGYSAANYLANAMTIVPVLVLPLIAIKERGAAAAGYYYIAYQIANLLFTVAFAVSQSLFAEGSHLDTTLRDIARRSAALQGWVIVPAALVVAVVGHYVLAAFGSSYADHATLTLVVFAASAPAVGLNNWASTLMRINHQLAILLLSNVVYVVVMCGLAIWWAQRGLGWIAFAWLIGNAAAGLVGLVAVAPRLGSAPPPGAVDGAITAPAS